MRIALLADIHDRLPALDLALRRAEEEACGHLMFMGDMAGTATLRHLLAQWGKGIDLVFGNNEWERETFRLMAAGRAGATLHGDAGATVIDGRRLFLCHMPYLAEAALRDGGYDAIFYGHTHRADLRPAGPGRPLIVNPGDVQGRYGRPSIAIYDTACNSAQLIPLTPR